MSIGMYAITLLPFLAQRSAEPQDGADRRLAPEEELRVYGCAVSARPRPRVAGSARAVQPRLLSRSWVSVLRALAPA